MPRGEFVVTTPNLGALYLRHGERMIRTAASVLRRDFGLTDGDLDVVQEVFRELQQRPPKEEIQNWEAYLVRVTQRRAIDWGRRQHVSKLGRSFNDEDYGPEPEDERSEDLIREVEAEVDLAARIPDLLDAMQTLTPNEKRVILQQFFHDASRDDLASEFGVSPARVSQLRTSGLKKLRTYMEGR